MKNLYLLWIFLLVGTIFIFIKMVNINRTFEDKTDPKFDIIKFEIPPDMEYSKKIFNSIKTNGFTDSVKSNLYWDNWFIPFYVGATILAWILLLKNFGVNKILLFALIADFAIAAGVLDFFENRNLVNCLSEWNEDAVRRAALFAKIKFAIILPLIGSVLLGWIYFFWKKRFRK